MALLSVTDLNRLVRELLDAEPLLQGVMVQGEMANVRLHSSGHLYFSLRDAGASVRAVMFRGQARQLVFSPQDGMQVICAGRVSLYERDGSYQLYAEMLEPAGVGAEFLRLQQLKEKLQGEGLFSADRKRPLPLLPRRLGVVTSPTGAAIRDILSVARRRYPNLAVVVAPVQVQGPTAAAEIAAAITLLAEQGQVDVIVVGRGGGSQEDLAAFNQEQVARAVAACPVPVVAAVGHETDTTLIDLVADRRAATPSAAAELAVPVVAELVAGLQMAVSQMQTALDHHLALAGRQVDAIVSRRVMSRPLTMLEAKQERTVRLEKDLGQATGRRLQEARARLMERSGRLAGLSPLAVLRRGFAVVEKEGKTVRDATGLQVGDRLRTRLQVGSFESQVERVES
ncbi:MAG: exodeoxyribonuclease VII large subunit [Sulfobacillus sp.]